MKQWIPAVALVASSGLASVALAQAQTVNAASGGYGLPAVNGNIQNNEYGPGNSYRYGVSLGAGRTPAGSVALTGATTAGAGGGGGFGGQVGQAQVFMNSSGGANPVLTIGFLPGATLNDVAVIFLDTRAGGITAANQATDSTDGSRRAITALLRTNTSLPATFDPDYAVVFSQFGSFLFQIDTFAGGISGASRSAYGFFNGTNTPGFSSNGSTTSNNAFRELQVPYAALGVTVLDSAVDFTVGYSSDTGFVSNETLPASANFNSGANPGFNGGAQWTNFNRFIPTPGASALLALGGLLASRRRRA